MRYSKLAKPLVLFLFCCALSAIALEARGDPGSRDVELSIDPLLVQARALDPGFQPPERMNQQQAEKLYLQFIRENPDNPLVPYLYYRLGHIFTSLISDEEVRLGAVKDQKKAWSYFKKSVEAYPKDKVSGMLIRVRVNVAALAPTKEQQVKEYVDYYKWLNSLTREDFVQGAFYSEHQHRFFEARPEMEKQLIDEGMKRLPDHSELAALNMVSVAKNAPPEIRENLLKSIEDALADQQPGILARAELDKLAKLPPAKTPVAKAPSAKVKAQANAKSKRNLVATPAPLPLADGQANPSAIWWWLAGGALVMTGAVLAVGLRQKRERTRTISSDINSSE